MQMQESLPEQKKRLRADLSRSFRGQADLPGEDLEKRVADSLFETGEYQKAKSIFIYVSFGREVPTRAIIARALSDGRTVCVPKCEDGGIMHAVCIRSLEGLVQSRMGMLEPADMTNLVLKKDIDFAVIPALACDRLGTRLGRGGGYYDRFLEKRTFKAAALCPSRHLFDAIPKEPHDATVDMIITEKGVIVP